MKEYLIVALASFLVLASPGVALGKSDNANSGHGNSDNSQKQSQQKDQGGDSQHGHVIIGNIKSVGGTEIEVEDLKDGTSSGKIDKNTKIVSHGKGAPISVLRKNGLVALISEDASSSASKSGSPKKIVKIYYEDASASAHSKRNAVQGVITAINGSTLTISHQIHQDRQWTVTVTPTTLIKMKDSASATAASLQVGMRVVAIGDNTGKGITAVRIQVIPGLAKGITNKQPVSSGSASPSGSPEASASATPTPTP
jgi:hypothetical protein